MSNDRDLTLRQIPPEQLLAARLLLRGGRSAVLATFQDSQPYTALVTPAWAPDGGVVLLLSTLSRHTAHLRANPLCSLLVQAETTLAFSNPQSAPRLSLACVAAPALTPSLKNHFLAVHPYASLYSDFSDFGIWRLAMCSVHFVGGFAQAWSIDAETFLASAPALGAPGTHSEIVECCNRDCFGEIASIGKARTGMTGAWRIVAVNSDGCYLSLGDAVIHEAWPRPISDPAMVCRSLSAMGRLAQSED